LGGGDDDAEPSSILFNGIYDSKKSAPLYLFLPYNPIGKSGPIKR
jgi:hypothetical protein